MITVVDTYKGYRIAQSGKSLKVYKPEGGALSYQPYTTIEAAHTAIDTAIRYAAAQEEIVFASDCR